MHRAATGTAANASKHKRSLSVDGLETLEKKKSRRSENTATPAPAAGITRDSSPDAPEIELKPNDLPLNIFRAERTGLLHDMEVGGVSGP